jgi:hypothetical protein
MEIHQNPVFSRKYSESPATGAPQNIIIDNEKTAILMSVLLVEETRIPGENH